MGCIREIQTSGCLTLRRPRSPSESSNLHFLRLSEGLGKTLNKKGLLPGCPARSAPPFRNITHPHLPDHHVLGSSSYRADAVLTVFSHQAVRMQVDVFSICDQLNNNLCRSHIVADLYKKHISKLAHLTTLQHGKMLKTSQLSIKSMI